MKHLYLQKKESLSSYKVKVNSILDLESDLIEVKPFIKSNKKALLFRFSHSKINTQLILTDVTPYVLIFFDEELEFVGATFSIKSGEGNFVIQTQYKTILMVKLPMDFELNEIDFMRYENSTAV